MARCNDQAQPRYLAAKTQESPCHGLLLPLVSAGREQEGIPVTPSEGLQIQRGLKRDGVGRPCRIVFHVAGPSEDVGADAEGVPPRRVLLFRQGDHVESVEERSRDPARPAKAPLGAFREAGIEQNDGNAEATTCPHPVRPEVGLHHEERRGDEFPDKKRGENGKVNRIGDRFKPFRGVPFHDGESRRGGRAQQEACPRIVPAECCGEFQRDPDLPDAHGMKPDSAGAHPLQRLLVEDSEALGRLGPVSAAPRDPEQVSGQQEQQDGDKEKIVEQEAHPLHDHRRRIRIRDSP